MPGNVAVKNGMVMVQWAPSSFTRDSRAGRTRLARRVDLVHLVYLVCLVYLVSLVYPLSLVPPNKRDRPDRPNNGLLMLADFFSILLER